MWNTLRTRRRKEQALRGLDALANRWIQRGRHARRGLGHLRREAEAIDQMSSHIEGLSERALDEQMQQVRQAFARRNYTPGDLRMAMAVIREVGHRELGQRAYVVQMMGALGLFHGQIVEMMTGEGKTLVGSLAATLLGWLRKPVHLVTVNDYLAERDAQFGRPLYERCGISAGAVVVESSDRDRRAKYLLPLVYTTQKELVADWLRDGLRLGRLMDPVAVRWLAAGGVASAGGRRARSPVMVPGLHAAIVDEVDAILIDEAVTPLIIAQPRGEDPQGPLFQRACKLAERLRANEDYEIDYAARRVQLTLRGCEAIAAEVGTAEHALWRASRRREELVEQALVARLLYHEGQHYQIVEDQVVIVDEYTGRYMHDRQWQHGLHQAVEARHGLEITADRDTLASMSFQRFFRQYPHLCGMTGTAAESKTELETAYGLPVRAMPTHRPVRRRRWPSRVYVSLGRKWAAVVEQVEQMHDEGRPVLIGTRSIETSEMLSGMLSERELEHQVLNAVHLKAEAQIVAAAGQAGAITVATNMAGRGTDIKLGAGVAEKGGLHIILTERHSAGRIDRQLVGRAGRQGDPGSAQCVLSLEDDLLLQWLPRTAAAMRGLFARRGIVWRRLAAPLYDLAQKRAQRRAFHARLAIVRHETDLDRSLPR